MPLVRVAMMDGGPEWLTKLIGDAVQQALVETIHIPPTDRFQLFVEHAGGFFYDAEYLNISRTDRLIMIQITISLGRTVEMKKTLFKRVNELLTKSGQVRPEDVMINIEEVQKENWSFGNGVAQYVT